MEEDELIQKKPEIPSKRLDKPLEKRTPGGRVPPSPKRPERHAAPPPSRFDRKGSNKSDNYHQNQPSYNPPARRESPRNASRPAPVPVQPSSPSGPVKAGRETYKIPTNTTAPSSSVDIENVKQMKDTMIKKAEEKKRLKEEEEARMERERRERCAQKLKELEEKKSKNSSPVIAPSPPVIQPTPTGPEVAEKWAAYNEGRTEQRERREAVNQPHPPT